MKVEDNNALFMKYYESKSEEDYEKLFLNNISLIKYIITKTVKLPLLTHKQIIDEFIDVGYIGLVQAIKKYDPSKMKKVSFTTFAYSCIHHEICKALKERPKGIDGNFSLEHNFVGSEEDTCLTDFLGYDDDKLDNIIEDYYNEYLKKIVLSMLETLNNPRDIEILKMYYGINDENKRYNYREIGEKFNCTRENIRHIINNSLEKIKERLKKININDLNAEYIDLSLDEIEKTMQKYKNRKSVHLTKLLEKHSKEEINKAIDKLEENYKTILKMYLGIDGKYMTYKEISQKTNVSITQVVYHVNTAFNKIQKMLDKSEHKEIDVFKKYEIEVIEDAIKMLNNDEQKFCKTYIECNGSTKKIAKIYKVDVQTIYNLKYKVFTSLDNIIKKGYNKTDIYNKFINIYGEKKVKEAMSLLSEDQREIIEKCIEYNYDSNELCKYYSASDKNKIYTLKGKAFKNLELVIRGKKLSVRKKTIKEKFLKIIEGKSQSEYNLAIKKLNAEDKKMLDIIIENNFVVADIIKKYNMNLSEAYSKIKKLLQNLNLVLKSKQK